MSAPHLGHAVIREAPDQQKDDHEDGVVPHGRIELREPEQDAHDFAPCAFHH